MALINWKNGTTGDWNQNTNWSTNTVPGSADDATIGATRTYTITVSNSGPGPVDGVLVTDPFPSNFSVTSWSAVSSPKPPPISSR